MDTQRSSKHYAYYTIEYQTDSTDDTWYLIGDRCFGLKGYKFGEHTACGRCWQTTGEYGMFDRDYAVRFLQDLRKALAENKITHVAKSHRITQFRLVIIEKIIERTLLDV